MNEFKANASFQVLPLLIQLQDVVMVITSWFCVSSISFKDKHDVHAHSFV